MNLFPILTMTGSVIGGILLTTALLTADLHRIELGEWAAVAAALTVIPYCFARSVQFVEEAKNHDNQKPT